MNEKSLGGPLIVASLLLGLSILGSGYFLSKSIDRGALKLDALVAAIEQMPTAAPSPGDQARRSNRPDPNKRYDISVGTSPTLGPKDAAVTIVEWSDFQCPFCARVGPTLKQVRDEYGDDVRIVFKHLPLSIHSKAPAAHAAAEAAHEQGRFWEMHDKIFAAQRQMSPEKYVEYAKELGLDMDEFERAVGSKTVKGKIDADVRTASELKVTGTPSMFINGRFLSGAQPFDSFKRIIDEELKKKS